MRQGDANLAGPVRVVSDGDTIAVVPLRPRVEAEERIEP